MIANEVGSPNVNQKICLSKCSELGMERWERDNPVLKAKCIKKKESIAYLCFFTVRSHFIISKYLIPFSIQSLSKSLNSALFFYMKQSLKTSDLQGVLEGSHLHNMVHFRGLL